MADVFNLLFYVAQQIGMTLGVGAQTTMLIAYVIAMRDRSIDQKEAQFARAVRRALRAGLWFIIISGLGVSAIHALAGQWSVVFAPAFLFKWILVLVLFFEEWITERVDLPNGVWEGFAGGTWYALFILHVLAPVATWGALLMLYAVWMIGFALCWGAIAYSTRGKGGSVDTLKKTFRTSAPVIQPRQTPTPPQPYKPIVIQTSSPVAPAPPRAVAQSTGGDSVSLGKTEIPMVKDASPDLPAIRIMPQTPEDIPRQTRPAVVQFN